MLGAPSFTTPVAKYIDSISDTLSPDLVPQVLASGYFDPQYYARSTGSEFASDEMAATHYVIYGEAKNLRPSVHFDPLVYRLSYPDLFGLQSPLLLHFANHGRAEGRSAIFDLETSMNWGEQPYAPGRPTLLLTSHDASITGAPILALNIARHISKSFNLILLLLHGGPLMGEFRRYSHLVIGPETGRLSSINPSLLAERVLRYIKSEFGLDAILANSAESDPIITAGYYLNIPVITLVHEFSEYILPNSRVKRILDYSTSIIFSSQLTENSARTANLVGDFRHSIVIPQGKSAIPLGGSKLSSLYELIQIGKKENKFLVIGCGYVQIRKGVDIFIATAAKVAKLLGVGKVQFLWVGDGYDPDSDYHYSIWLKDQIARSGLEDVVTIIPAIGAKDLEKLYREADAMFLSSRLDPFPNVSIDAITAGLPVVCFERATGVSEYISKIEGLVAPYLDIEAAAEALVRIASDEAHRKKIRRGLKTLAASEFDMAKYVSRLEEIISLARSIADREREDSEILISAGVLSSEMAGDNLGADHSNQDQIRHYVRLVAAGTNIGRGGFRRPMVGFSPHIYKEYHPKIAKPPFPNPLAHWIIGGRKEGPWIRDTLELNPSFVSAASPTPTVAIHLHLHYSDLIDEFLTVLKVNRARPDLFISVTTKQGRECVAKALDGYPGKKLIRLVPNRGRDLGAMLTEFGPSLRGYDIFGHLHGKKSTELHAKTGDIWRNFLSQTLVGGEFSALDQIVDAFAQDASLGLAFPEDPTVVGWQQNYEQAHNLRSRLKLTGELPRNIEFPVGNMFYARPKALEALFEASFSWDDYPEEPVSYDGTILHAIERLTPIICEHAGYRWMTVHAPGVTR